MTVFESNSDKEVEVEDEEEAAATTSALLWLDFTDFDSTEIQRYEIFCCFQQLTIRAYELLSEFSCNERPYLGYIYFLVQEIYVLV